MSWSNKYFGYKNFKVMLILKYRYKIHDVKLNTSTEKDITFFILKYKDIAQKPASFCLTTDILKNELLRCTALVLKMY